MIKKIKALEKRVSGYFSIKQMKKEIYGYGYTYSNIKYFLFVVFSIVFVFAAGIFYQMRMPGIILATGVFVISIPFLVRTKYKNINNKKRFNEVDLYLHQMIYSFQKNPKICTALDDILKISTGTLKKTVKKAKYILDNSTSETLLEDALKVIEKEYDNTRIKTLHKYLIDIEMKGGEYSASINIILMDIDNWINRTYAEQNEMERVKLTTVVGLIVSLVIGGCSSIFSYVMNNNKNVMAKASIANDSMYQISCVVFFIVCILYFIYTQVSYNRDWVTKTLNEKIVMKDYKNATEFNPNAFRITCIPLYIIIAIIGFAVYFLNFIPMNKVFSVIIAVFDMYMIFSPNIIKNTAIRNTKKNIQDSFSEWLRDVSLNLQQEPLLSAIQDTYNNCPIVLKPELEIFLKKIEDNPLDVEPYYEFLARFHLLDINAAIRNLYSLSDADINTMDEQLSALIKRNYELINKNETGASSDRISVMKFSEYIPVLFASLKLGIDMVCLVSIMI